MTTIIITITVIIVTVITVFILVWHHANAVLAAQADESVMRAVKLRAQFGLLWNELVELRVQHKIIDQGNWTVQFILMTMGVECPWSDLEWQTKSAREIWNWLTDTAVNREQPLRGYLYQLANEVERWNA